MQCILGAGGAIGKELAKALPQFTDKIRLVSRNPEKVNAQDELFPANLLNYDEVLKAVEGCDIVYLTVGLPYQKKVWKEQWPIVMENVLNACKSAGAKLVFFDNIYAYDGSHLNPITEKLPIAPSSIKGQVRALLLEMIDEARNEDNMDILIARAADFYGPSIKDVSLLTESVIKPLSEGKTANWFGPLDKQHSFTFTPDAGKATALLGNTPDAYGEAWHLPTAPNPPTGKEWVESFAAALGAKPKVRSASKTMLRILGLFVPVMKEFVEMYYQYEQDYVFSSKKFEERFDFKPSSYQDGIRMIVEQDYAK
jgi:nucleoside-diphosphate-sugar epimerase